MDNEIRKKIKDLEKAGYKVKKDVKTTKKTFEVSEDTLDTFMAIVKDRDLLVKDAIESAIGEWNKKYK